MAGGLPAAAFCAAANHLLAQQPGLAAGLAPHAGKALRIELPGFVLQMRVTAAGLFSPLAETEADEAPAGCIRLPSPLFLRLALEGRTALRAADATGDAQLLDAVNQVFGQLDWDAEADLSALLGPVAGVRVTRLLQQLPIGARHGAKTLLLNVADYATEEAGWLAGARDIARFNREVDELADHAARLEARLTHLERC